jgi:hypothetical protein
MSCPLARESARAEKRIADELAPMNFRRSNPDISGFDDGSWD